MLAEVVHHVPHVVQQRRNHQGRRAAPLPRMPGAGKGLPGTPRGLSARSSEMPRAPGTSASVRTSMVMRSLREAWVIQVLAPVMRNTSPSRTARVLSDARSDPEPGSVNTAVGRMAPLASPGR
jgi:hypothetical protein